jgi:hypothetical protein
MAQPAATAKSLVSGCTAGMVPKPKTFRNHWKRRNKPNGLLKREIETAKRESFTYCLEDATSHQAQSQKAQARWPEPEGSVRRQIESARSETLRLSRAALLA